MEVGKIFNNFKLIKKKEIKDLDSVFYEFEHVKNKGHVMFLSNNDNNKVFSYTFRTIPEDSTGICHIIEHSVLCGSHKYPLKEPFVNLLKSSMSTFLNAMTASDWTTYPVASCNDKDFKNLMDVYLDAVLNPLSKDDMKPFLQEGWHYELFNKEDPITYKGVVYNEMKGAMSSVDRQLEQAAASVLYKGSSYEYNSGGEPDDIPNLTYDYYQDFYHNHYNPTNGLIYLYGDMDILETLEYLDSKYLNQYEFIKPVEVTKPVSQICQSYKQEYAISPDEDKENNTYYCLAYGLDNYSNRLDLLGFEMLNQVLFSGNDSPIKKKLLDSGLFQDVSTMIEDDCYKPGFFLSLEKAKENKLEEAHQLFLNIIKDAIKEGINKDDLLAVINNAEFKNRELDFGRLPKGIALSFNVIQNFIYELPLEDALEFSQTFAKLRELVNTNFYEELLEKYILNSNHYVCVELMPSHTLASQKKALLEEKLENYKKSLSDEEIDNLIKLNNELLAYQSHIDTKEEIATLPMLELSDIKEEIKTIPTLVSDNKIIHEFNTNGIAYLKLYFNLDGLKEEQIPYANLLVSLFDQLDTTNLTLTELKRYVRMNLGSLSFTMLQFGANKNDLNVYGLVECSALNNNIFKMEKPLNELMNNLIFDKEKIRIYLDQLKTILRNSIIERGNSCAAVLTSSATSKLGRFNSMTSGYEFYSFVSSIIENNDYDNLISKLKEVYQLMFNKQKLIKTYSGSSEAINQLDLLVDKLNLADFAAPKMLDLVIKDKLNLALVIPSTINYNAVSFNAEDSNLFNPNEISFKAHMGLLNHIIRYDFLWSEIRVKGGAYGTSIGISKNNDIYFSTYRDPNVKNTYQTFERISDYIRNVEIDEDGFRSYIIGFVGSSDAPGSNNSEILKENSYVLSNVTIKQREELKRAILDSNISDIKELANLFDEIYQNESLATIGSEATISQFNFKDKIVLK